MQRIQVTAPSPKKWVSLIFYEGSNFFPWPSSGGAWTDHIDGSFGNFKDSGDPWEPSYYRNADTDLSTAPVSYYNGDQTPSGVDMKNGYGIYDLFGNVSEWCWDRELTDWYSLDEALDDNSKGPNSGLGRTRSVYGVNWLQDKFSLTHINKPRPYLFERSGTSTSYFTSEYASDIFSEYIVGFRTVRSH